MNRKGETGDWTYASSMGASFGLSGRFRPVGLGMRLLVRASDGLGARFLKGLMSD
ncbi:hypothetical protein [Pyrinomonas sp.]|uniref:hypothetical protein n=1 Tax=Pyrinomonas sp. TaxID=2080306 RepID=UPI00333191DB